MSEQKTNQPDQPVKHTAGAFDVRTFIAALMGIFGVILLLTGIFGGESTATTTSDAGNANLYVGIALIVFAALMQTWAVVRPTVVDEAELAKQKAEAEQMGGHSAH